ncbi:MAG: DNA-3-methyladenine glycosylase family protein [Longimicrobiales bacterium]
MGSEVLETPRGYRLRRTLGVYRMGGGDPTLHLSGRNVGWALSTPEGPVTLQAEHTPAEHTPGRLRVCLEGAGAQWMGPKLPGLFGLLDDPTQFAPSDPVMRGVWKRSLGLHLPRLPTVFHRLMQVILLQLVTTADGNRAWSRIVRAFGNQAPGDRTLMIPPTSEVMTGIPWYRYVADGVPHRQARALAMSARKATEIEQAAATGIETLSEYLRALPGIGPWTVGYLTGTAMADADAVLLGDYHLPHTATWVLRKQARGTDQDFLELLEPYRGNRFRIIRALWASGVKAPRYGPKRAPRPLYRER